MSIIVTQIRMPFEADEAAVIGEAFKRIKAKHADADFAGIYKESIDLRHGTLSKIYSVELSLQNKAFETKAAESCAGVSAKPSVHMPEITGSKKLSSNPVVIGFGPAGMFAALILAERGFAPIVLERGSTIDKRDKDISLFFERGKINTASNIQFGEGGAGTYSDGKLTTRINDPFCLLATEMLENHGAPKDVMHLAKPHIGTDLLKSVVKSIRSRIEALGGRVIFDAPVTEIIKKSGKLSAVVTPKGVFDTETAILAIGHSARDTVQMLYDRGVQMLPKAFSVGLRVEHLQEWVNDSVYGKFAKLYDLPAAEYAVSAKHNGRGCYSFCMCPGGQVIAAASEEGGVVTNGMSYHARNGRNANSAICVSVTPDDFSTPLGGIEFQRKLERAAFEQGGKTYAAPVQLVSDLLNGESGSMPKSVDPSYPLSYELTDFSKWMPKYIIDPLKASIPDFAKKFSFFANPQGVFTGVESRTSSPVRIVRGEDMQAPGVKGLIPCGEGAGYAGGIMSAAVDGIKAAGQILSEYRGI